MKPSRRRMTVRDLIVFTVLFALDFGAITAVFRHPARDPLFSFLALIFFLGPFAILFVMTYLYVPPRLDEILIILLILVLLVVPLFPATQSR